jgi:hypothetical protein
MVWNPAIPATNADLLSAPVRDNFGALETTLMAPLTAATDGYLLYRAAGPTVSGEANLLWDATNNNLKLFGGGIGTSGQGILALGPATAPTTSPVDTVQLYTGDLDGEAGSRGLILRDERNHTIELGSIAAASRLTIRNTCTGSLTVKPTEVSVNLSAAAGGGRDWAWISYGSAGGYRGAGSFSLWNAVVGEIMSINTSQNWFMYITGLGMRQITGSGADAAGAGYRYLVIPN